MTVLTPAHVMPSGKPSSFKTQLDQNGNLQPQALDIIWQAHSFVEHSSWPFAWRGHPTRELDALLAWLAYKSSPEFLMLEIPSGTTRSLVLPALHTFLLHFLSAPYSSSSPIWLSRLSSFFLLFTLVPTAPPLLLTRFVTVILFPQLNDPVSFQAPNIQRPQHGLQINDRNSLSRCCSLIKTSGQHPALRTVRYCNTVPIIPVELHIGRGAMLSCSSRGVPRSFFFGFSLTG